jgi:hypothetical protein
MLGARGGVRFIKVDHFCCGMRQKSSKCGRANLIIDNAKRITLRGQAQDGAYKVLAARGVHPTCTQYEMVATGISDGGFTS